MVFEHENVPMESVTYGWSKTCTILSQHDVLPEIEVIAKWEVQHLVLGHRRCAHAVIVCSGSK